MYMSYCRFEGTNAELRACLSDIEEVLNEENEYPISEREATCFCYMVENFVDFLHDADLLDEDGELDTDMLKALRAKMVKEVER